MTDTLTRLSEITGLPAVAATTPGQTQSATTASRKIRHSLPSRRKSTRSRRRPPSTWDVGIIRSTVGQSATDISEIKAFVVSLASGSGVATNVVGNPAAATPRPNSTDGVPTTSATDASSHVVAPFSQNEIGQQELQAFCRIASISATRRDRCRQQCLAVVLRDLLGKSRSPQMLGSMQVKNRVPGWDRCIINPRDGGPTSSSTWPATRPLWLVRCRRDRRQQKHEQDGGG